MGRAGMGDQEWGEPVMGELRLREKRMGKPGWEETRWENQDGGSRWGKLGWGSRQGQQAGGAGLEKPGGDALRNRGWRSWAGTG